MKDVEAIIFDMDGCLYPLDRGAAGTFAESKFGQSVKRREVEFIAHQLGVGIDEAKSISDDVKDRHERHLSIGLEREFDIPRDVFFEFTWGVEPGEYVDKQTNLRPFLGGLAVRPALLSAAPRIWVEKVIDHLEVRDIFGEAIFCGDSDVRKPSLAAFCQVIEFLECNSEGVISIGDQEHTDILPAKLLGMVTVRIGQDTDTEADFLAPDITTAIEKLREEGFQI